MTEIPKVAEVTAEMQTAHIELARSWEPELREYLPDLPSTLNIMINNDWLIPGYGIGGYAKDEHTVELAFDPQFDGDKEQQLVDAKGSFFHEAYHVAQGFLGEDSTFSNLTFLQNGILEGAATKFEMIRTGSKPGWGEYPKDEIYDWYEEVVDLPYINDGDEWGRWKFYDPATERKWILYRVGCYVIDEAMEKSGKQIEDLAHLHPDEILALSDLQSESLTS